MLVEGFHHASINVDDLDAARHFYVDVLGLEVLPRPEMSISGLWLDAGDGRQIHLISLPDVAPDKGQHFAFRVADVDATVAKLRKAGIDIPEAKQIADVAKASQCHDPCGNRVEFNQPLV